MVDQAPGVPSFLGYEYQILAAVWVGLDLAIRRRCCDHIVVEPASQEDVAAHLRVDDERASATVRSASPEGYPVEIQIKLRRSGHWTKSQFVSVLRGAADKPGTTGPPGRIRPIQHLIASPECRYTILTDARVNDDLASFRVAEIGELSAAADLPEAQWQDLVPSATAKRIGVLTERTPELLVLRIQEILRLVHVPATKADACIAALQGLVRDRILGKRPTRWGRDEIESVVTGHDGFPERRRLAPLIRPSNYAQLQHHLATNHVLLVTGPPGSGKTHVSMHMAQEHRLQDDAYEVVEVQGGDGIGQVRSRLGSEGRLLFFIHDPWGMYTANDRAQEWASELPKLARRAGPDKKFLITSRTAIKEDHVPAEQRNVLTAADRAITEANYGQAERAEILRIATLAVGPAHADFVARHRQRILDQLRLPLAIEAFAQRLTYCEMPPEPRVDEMIRTSNVEAIGRTIQVEIEAQGDEAIAGAIVLWALFSPRLILSPEEAQQGREDATQGGYHGRLDPERLLINFARAKRLKAAADLGAFCAHPTFLEGLDGVVQAHPGTADGVLSKLLAGMCDAGRAEKTRRIVRHLTQRRAPIPARAQDALNRHLIEQIGRTDRFDAYRAISELAEYGDGNHPVTLLARALTVGARDGFGQVWQPPEMAATDIDAIGRSSQARDAARIFVQFGLLDDLEVRYDAQGLVSFLARFGWDFTAEFLDGLRQSFGIQSVYAPMMAHAALLGVPPPFDEVLAAAFRELDRVHQELDGMQDQLRRADQGELGGEEACRIFEQPTEQLWAPERVLEVLVRLRRLREGHGWLEEHPRISDLLESWACAIDAGATAEEVGALLARCPAGDRRLGWRAVGRARVVALADQLLAALPDAPELELPDLIRAISLIVPRAEWSSRVVPLLADRPLWRRAQILSAVDRAQIEPSVADSLLPHLLRAGEPAALEACARWDGPGSIREMLATFAASERMALRGLLRAPDAEQGVKAGLVLYELGEDVSGLLSPWTRSAAATVRSYAYHLAGMARGKQGLRILRRRGMRDPEYRCRRVAMGYLALNAAKLDWMLVRRSAHDPSAPIREYCAELIGRHRHQPGESTLFLLAGDTRDSSEDHYLTIYGAPNHHVARAAAAALGRLPHLSPTTQSKIIAFVRRGGDSCPDWVVHYHLVNCLAWRSNSDQLPLFMELLADDRYLPGPRKSGFPIRYAAAWGVANILREDPKLADSIDLARVYTGARHPDPRLAGPCLIALGSIDPRAREAVREAIRGLADAPARADLYVLAAALATGSPPEDSLASIAAPQLTLDIAKYLAVETPPNNVAWREWIGQRPSVRAWLESIQASENLQPALRYVLWKLAGSNEYDFVSACVPQANDLAEMSPLVTVRRLMGGE